MNKSLAAFARSLTMTLFLVLVVLGIAAPASAGPIKNCLSSDPVVSCGYAPGTFLITIHLKGNGGNVPQSVEIIPLKPGITIAAPASTYPVIGGIVQITLKGAYSGDVVDLQVNGSTTMPDPKTGLSQCCNGKITVKIPAGLDCGTPKLAISKICEPAKLIKVPVGNSSSGLAYVSKCKITVDSYGPITGLLSVSEYLSANGGKITALSSGDPWSCLPDTPAAANSLVSCKMLGSVMSQPSDSSVIDVAVQFATPDEAYGAENCAGLKNEGKKIDQICEQIVLVAAAIIVPPVVNPPKQLPVVTPPKPKPIALPPVALPSCDPATATPAGELCRCRFDYMQKTSKTSCRCSDGYSLRKGQGCFPDAPKCDGVTAKEKNGECACIYKNMNPANASSCSCTRGNKFIAGRGCIPIEPVCDNGTKYNKERGRCEPACGSGYQYNVKRNKCFPLELVCDDGTQYNKDRDRCEPICDDGYQYSVKRNRCLAVQPVCNDGEVYNPNRNRCEQLRPDCGDGEVYNPKRNRCEQDRPVCNDGEVYNPKRNRCDQAQTNCDNGYVYDRRSNSCVEIQCPDGTELVRGKCRQVQQDCPEGTEFIKGRCREVQQQCPEGTEFVRGKCRRVQQTCEFPMIPLKGQCIDPQDIIKLFPKRRQSDDSTIQQNNGTLNDLTPG